MSAPHLKQQDEFLSGSKHMTHVTADKISRQLFSPSSVLLSQVEQQHRTGLLHPWVLQVGT